MTEREALLAAVRSNLADDLPRLVFADYLEEHDEAALAQFIRDDIAADKLPRFDPVRIQYETLEKPRRVKLAESLASPLPPGGTWLVDTSTRRGFPWAIEITFNIASTHPDFHLYEMSTAESLRARLGTFPPDRLLASPWKDRLTHLEIVGPMVSAASLNLIRETPFPSLNSLGFGHESITPGMLTDVVRSPLLQQVSAFSIRDIPVGRAVATVFQEFPPLKKLTLYRTRLSQDALTNLLNSDSAAELEDLTVGGDYPAAGSLFRVLAAAPHIHRLRSLSITGTQLGAGAQALAEAEQLSNLKELNLSACVIHAPEVATLLRGFCLRNVVLLDLSANPLGDEGAMAIRTYADRLSNLRVLNLRYAQIGDRGIQHLADSRWSGNCSFLMLATINSAWRCDSSWKRPLAIAFPLNAMGSVESL